MDLDDEQDDPALSEGGYRPAPDSRGAVGQASGNVQWDRVEEILAAVNGRWAVTILRYLAIGISRPADLLQAVNDGPDRLSRKVMFEVLARLVNARLVRRAETRTWPRQTHYWLTAEGHEILNEISKLGTSDSGWLSMGQDPPEPPRGIDVSTAHPARIWDAFLGGKDNFAVDREAARLVTEAMPSLPVLARSGRRFQADAVRRLLRRDVRQFLDIGTGLPAVDSVHEIAGRAAPESRIVYVDNDPLVVTHARALLTSSAEGTYSYIDADLREPGKILAHAAQTLDLARPVAILLLGVLHFIADADDPWAITARLIDGVTGEAYLVIGHGASDIRPQEAAQMTSRYNQRSAAPIRMRTRAEVARFFSGMQVLEPGLVPLAQWRPSGSGASPAEDLAGYVGIGWRPVRSSGQRTLRGSCRPGPASQAGNSL